MAVWRFWCAALLVACGAEGGSDPRQCPLALAPDGEHDAVLGDATDRLFAATGADFGVDGCGLPVVFEPQVYALDREVCAVTLTHMNGVPAAIHVATEPTGACMPLTETVMHEVIHTVAGGGVHARHGLFAADADPAAVLRGESLDMLCAALGGCNARRDESLPQSPAAAGPVMP